MMTYEVAIDKRWPDSKGWNDLYLNNHFSDFKDSEITMSIVGAQNGHHSILNLDVFAKPKEIAENLSDGEKH